MLTALFKRLERPFTAKLTRRHLERFLEAQQTAAFTLDLGAGQGPYARFFPNRVSIDVESNPHLDVRADAHALPFLDGTFEVVLATEVLEHLTEPQRGIDEMRRVLRPGGRLILTTRFLFPVHDAPGDYFRFTAFGLRHLLRRFDIDCVTEETDAVGTIAVLIQRLGLQAQTLGWRPFRYLWLVLARLVQPFSFLITREYGDARGRRTEQRMMTSGYYVVCRKPAS